MSSAFLDVPVWDATSRPVLQSWISSVCLSSRPRDAIRCPPPSSVTGANAQCDTPSVCPRHTDTVFSVLVSQMINLANAPICKPARSTRVTTRDDDKSKMVSAASKCSTGPVLEKVVVRVEVIVVVVAVAVW